MAYFMAWYGIFYGMVWHILWHGGQKAEQQNGHTK